VLKEHYGHRPLTAEELTALHRLGGDARAPAPIRMRRHLLAVAGVLVLAGAAWIGLSRLAASTDRIADEMSYNHNKRSPVDFASSDIGELRLLMDRLDFTLIGPERLVTHEWRLIGARYCSVRGRVAAQLRYENQRDGLSYTLYETVLPEGLAGEEVETSVFKRGNRVTLWKERGLLLGLVGDE
jgi:hypothetical protein